MNIARRYLMCASEQTTTRPSARGWIGRSRGGRISRRSYKTCTDDLSRINLETGEQKVLSAHGAPVKSVVYSKEHCESVNKFNVFLLTSF
jgi:hypothetical protein